MLTRATEGLIGKGCWGFLQYRPLGRMVTPSVWKILVALTFFCGLGFPDSSVGKESACNAGDPGLSPGWGRSPKEGIDYPLQYSWASLVAQQVKTPPAMWETWVRTLGWEDPLEKIKASHSSILA